MDKKSKCGINWFENWFDSRYYHILYKNRNEAEAERFMNNLVILLQIKPGARIHDLCCGKGRHAVFLAKKGFEVTGTDLSVESITYARQFETGSLSFHVQDMRSEFRSDYFDFVFNLFTSFGYFSEAKDNEAVLHAVHASLKKEGVFVLDYLNARKTLEHLQKTETKTAEGIEFHVEKELKGGFIQKQIRFCDKGKEFQFRECVRAFSRQELETLLTKTGFQIVSLKGNYELGDFDEQNSDRLILIAKKI
jgi:SAM-dependent methyltransferase